MIKNIDIIRKGEKCYLLGGEITIAERRKAPPPEAQSTLRYRG
jgi:hypothetical protein